MTRTSTARAFDRSDGHACQKESAAAPSRRESPAAHFFFRISVQLSTPPRIVCLPIQNASQPPRKATLMTLFALFRSLFRRSIQPTRRRTVLQLEALEDRRLLSGTPMLAMQRFSLPPPENKIRGTEN